MSMHNSGSPSLEDHLLVYNSFYDTLRSFFEEFQEFLFHRQSCVDKLKICLSLDIEENMRQ